MRFTPKRWAAVLAAVTGLTVAITITAAATETDNRGDDAIDWKDCGAGTAECGELTVPVAHDVPQDDTVDLEVARLPARDENQRVGTLIFHGGGPAPSTPWLTEGDRQAAFDDLTAWFDVVTFDSRGYSVDDPMCDPDQAPGLTVLDSARDYQQQQEAVADYGQSCVDQDPALAAAASAADAADDIDALRQALGEDRISFFGNSYGTVFGQAYAERHGEHLERLYLDGVLDHTSSYADQAYTVGEHAEKALHRFAEDCEKDQKCDLYGEDVLAIWDDVVERAEAEPLPTSDGEEISATEIRAVGGNLDHRTQGAALAQARDGSGDGYAELLQAPAADAGQLTQCADFPVEPDDYQQLDRLAQQARQDLPRVGWVKPVTEAWRCTGWPIAASNPPGPITAPDAPPALAVNSDSDVATHIDGARNVVDQLDGSVLLEAEGLAHAIYLQDPDNDCIRDAVHDYLRTGQLPAEDTRCQV